MFCDKVIYLNLLVMKIELLIACGGIIILLSVLAYLTRKKVALSLVSIIYGPYSYEYLSTHKKYFVKSPYHYCFRDDFIAHLLHVLSLEDSVPSYKSKKDILFEDTPYFINYKEFLKKKGIPFCFNAFNFNHLGFEIKVLGYKSTVSGSKAIIVFYFMNDLFFMGEYIFKNPKTDIKAGMSALYLEKLELTEDSFYIENTKNRIIHFEDTGAKVDIKFLNREDQTIINKLTDYYSFKTGKQIVAET
jgi:hypothetical protein